MEQCIYCDAYVTADDYCESNAHKSCEDERERRFAEWLCVKCNEGIEENEDGSNQHDECHTACKDRKYEGY